MAKFETKDEDISANDYRAYFDSQCLRVWHLNGKERTFRIVKCTRFTGEMVSGKAREIKKQPKLELEDEKGRPVPLPLLLNKTNAKSIAQLYGNNPKQWDGKWITLFTATGIDTPQGPSDAIRVRNQVPKKTSLKPTGKALTDAATDAANGLLDHDRDTREPGDDDEPPPGALRSDNVAH